MLHPDARAKAHHILLSDEQTAIALKAKIDCFDEFCELAKQHSLCPSAKIGGDLGLTKPGVIVPELESAIFSEPLETTTGPFKTVHGYHLLWIKKRYLPNES